MKLIDEIKKTVVFIGYSVQTKKTLEDIFIGTGFLLNINNYFYVCTAKHVILDPVKNEIRKGIWAAIRLKAGKYQKIDFDNIKQKYSVDWLFHPVQKYDIALLPIELNQENNDFKLIPKDLFFESVKNKKTPELLQVFFCSYQPGVEKIKDINPIIRTGFISRVNKDNSLIIDANTFPGNSGSPVFVAPTTGLVSDEGTQIGNPFSGKFLGVITSYIPYRDVAESKQTGNPRIIFEENTGLANVHTHNVLEELIKSKSFKNQLTHLKQL
ncbi:MAG: serine protease [Candidatus Woykebacteria bacterium]